MVSRIDTFGEPLDRLYFSIINFVSNPKHLKQETSAVRGNSAHFSLLDLLKCFLACLKSLQCISIDLKKGVCLYLLGKNVKLWGLFVVIADMIFHGVQQNTSLSMVVLSTMTTITTLEDKARATSLQFLPIVITFMELRR